VLDLIEDACSGLLDHVRRHLNHNTRPQEGLGERQ
jgi:hypothetical protein